MRGPQTPYTQPTKELLQTSSIPQDDAVRGTSAKSAMTEPAGLSPEARVRRRFENLLRDSSPDKRHRNFLLALDSLSPEEAPGLRQLIHDLDREGMHFSTEWNAFIRRWGEVDGAAAMEHAISCRGEPWISTGVRDIFSGWASKNSAAAADWLNSHSEIPEFSNALAGLVAGIAESNPAAATRAAIDSLPPGNNEAAQRAMESIAEAVVRQQKAAGMLEWYNSLPSESGQDSLRNIAFGHIWWRLKHSDIDRAAEWLASESDKPWRSDQQYAETMTILSSKKSPQVALEWASKISPSPENGRWPGVGSVLRNWIATDSAAASAWIAAQPESPWGNYIRDTVSPASGQGASGGR